MGLDSKKVAEVARKADELWAKVSEKDRAPFQKKFEADKARYEKEMSTYDKPKDAGKKTKKTKDPDAPKRPQSAFFLWLGENRAKIIKDNKFSSKDIALVGKKAGEMWGKMPDKEKSPFQQKADRAKEAYTTAMAAYNK